MGITKTEMIITILEALGQEGPDSYRRLMSRQNGYLRIMYRQALRVLNAAI